ncbi:MAG: replicative DNA helicase [Actinomycetota bacterium]|nr:replicative DNA helicase [Actinomycetota bacterium]
MVQSIEDTRRRSRGVSGRVPPHNLQAEQSLLGAMLLSRDAIAAAVESCGVDDFYKPAHGHVFEAVCSLYGQGEPADPVTVADELSRAGLLEAVGGLPTLLSLQADTPATANAGRYGRIVEEHALLRRLIGVAGDIAEMGYSVPDDVAGVLDRAESLMFGVAERRVTDTLRPLQDLLAESLDRLEALFDRGESITGVPTGYIDLDERLSGLQPSSLVIVGARPAMGKCVAAGTRLVDPETGGLVAVEELYRRGTSGAAVGVLSMGDDQRLGVATPSAFVDDGVRPVFRVRTRLGREVRTTAAHPFLTPTGWRPLDDLAPGVRIGVPRTVPVWGTERLPEHHVALLAYLIGDGGCTGTSPRFTTASAAILTEVQHHAAVLGVGVRPCAAEERPAIDFRSANAKGEGNPLIDLLRAHGVWGKRAAEKVVPAAIFRLERSQVAFFLSRLFATDGTAWWTDSGDGDGRIGYASVSRQLVADVAHLLLRFGICARIRPRSLLDNGKRRRAWELEIMAATDIRRFCAEIGVTAAKPSNHNWSVGRRSPCRETVAVLAESLGSIELSQWEASDLYWDEIVAIVADGEQQVYDLTVPGTHNFVADDVLVHNTAFALGIAAHAAMEARTPVLVFSLEMSHAEITQRLLVSEARVDAGRIRNGRLIESDWPKINNAVGRLGEAPIHIDDDPNLTVMELRAKARRHKSRHGDLGLIIVDYLQLMSGRSSAENRQVEVSEISRGLKILARELEVPVLALSQLSRNLEMRADKRPQLADLRESGCMPASTRLLRADTGREVTLGELVLRQGQPLVWSLDDQSKMVPRRLVKAFPSGIKPVLQLRMVSGLEVDATANHRFRTIDGWKRLDELGPGDQLATPTAADSDLCPDVLWDKISAITPVGLMPTFDATVEDTHNFVANGIVAHNSLEQDADVVMFLYRDEIYDSESSDRGTAEVIVSKHRNGPTGTMKLAFLDHYTRFANMANV